MNRGIADAAPKIVRRWYNRGTRHVGSGRGERQGAPRDTARVVAGVPVSLNNQVTRAHRGSVLHRQSEQANDQGGGRHCEKEFGDAKPRRRGEPGQVIAALSLVHVMYMPWIE